MRYMGLFDSKVEDAWLISFQDKPVFTIDRNSGEVIIYDEFFLPFDCAVTTNTSVADLVSNITIFNSWCARRVLSLDRKYAKEILNFYGFEQGIDDATRAKIALATHCLSLNDCFWAKKITEASAWSDVNLFDNSLKDTIFDIALLGSSATFTNTDLITPDVNTDGTAPKAWVRKDDGFYLLKGDMDDSVTREVEASKILNDLGISTVSYSEDSFKDARVSNCKCFTSKNVNFVRAGRYKDWCSLNHKHFYQELKKYQASFDLMNIADFLVGNTDQHPNNWGFLYDNEINIYDMNPLMDYDHAFLGNMLTICTPALMTRGTVSQKQVALDTIAQYKDIINWDADLSQYKYGAYVEERLNLLKASL